MSANEDTPAHAGGAGAAGTASLRGRHSEPGRQVCFFLEIKQNFHVVFHFSVEPSLNRPTPAFQTNTPPPARRSRLRVPEVIVGGAECAATGGITAGGAGLGAGLLTWRRLNRSGAGGGPAGRPGGREGRKGGGRRRGWKGRGGSRSAARGAASCRVSRAGGSGGPAGKEREESGESCPAAGLGGRVGVVVRLR